MIAYIRNPAVQKKHWLSGGSFSDGVALCQTIPRAQISRHESAPWVFRGTCGGYQILRARRGAADTGYELHGGCVQPMILQQHVTGYR